MSIIHCQEVYNQAVEHDGVLGDSPVGLAQVESSSLHYWRNLKEVVSPVVGYLQIELGIRGHLVPNQHWMTWYSEPLSGNEMMEMNKMAS